MQTLPSELAADALTASVEDFYCRSAELPTELKMHDINHAGLCFPACLKRQISKKKKNSTERDKEPRASRLC